MKKAHWGIIGCGQIAVDKMLPAMMAANNVELVAVADPIAERRKLMGVKGYSSYLELLADPQIQAVYIALPTGMHLEAVLAAARAKKDILCEKPLGQNVAEVNQMIEAAERNGVRLMTAYMSRFSDLFQQACQTLQNGAIGEVTFTYANFSYPALEPYPPGAPGGWRWTDLTGGGPLLDIGVYLAFGLRELLNDHICTVNPRAVRTVSPENMVADTSMAWFVTSKGIPGVFAATFSHQECRIVVYGTKGKLEISDCFAQVPSGRLEVTIGQETTVTEASSSLPHFDNYRREIEHFSTSILNDSPFQPSPADALTDAKLLEALKGISP